MSLARSTYYYRPRRRAKDEDALKRRIEAICDAFPRYGYRRVTAQLRHEGWRVYHKRVARIMRESDLGVKPQRWRTGNRRPGAFTTPTVAASTVRRTIGRCWPSGGCGGR